ncbi:MAG: hypothetical protein GY856_20315, partial [bacterium]|nr:hypothetical protein [bacterium]
MLVAAGWVLLCVLVLATVFPGLSTAAPQDLRGFETFTIMEIQNTETFSPLTGRRLATSGVVTLVTADGTGFWLQDPAGDGNPATSDGLFVFLGREPAIAERPGVGDVIRLIGTVEEEQYSISLPRTMLSGVTLLEITARGHALPAPVPLVDLPDSELADAIAFWEPLEGMRVSLRNARVIGPTSGFGEFVVLTEADAVPGSGYFPEQQVMVMVSLGDQRVDYNPERIVIDDASLPEPIVVRPGDRLVSLTGVVDFTFGNYKVEPEPEGIEVVTQEPVSPPVSTRSGPAGNVTIVNYNLRDLFDAVDNPDRFDENFDPGSGRRGFPSAEEVDVRLAKHALAVIRELALPEVIVVQEFETTELLQAIGDRVNAEAGTRYRAASLETSDRRGLEVGFLFDRARVELVRYEQMSGPEVETVFGLTSAFRTREPLVGVFRFSAGGPPVTIIACKLKSKRGEPPFLQVNARPIRFTEPQREDQARVLRGFVNSLLAEDPNALVMVTGDLGYMEFAEPGEDEPAVGILEGGVGELALFNLIALEDRSDAYTWLL